MSEKERDREREREIERDRETEREREREKEARAHNWNIYILQKNCFIEKVFSFKFMEMHFKVVVVFFL